MNKSKQLSSKSLSKYYIAAFVSLPIFLLIILIVYLYIRIAPIPVGSHAFFPPYVEQFLYFALISSFIGIIRDYYLVKRIWPDRLSTKRSVALVVIFLAVLVESAVFFPLFYITLAHFVHITPFNG